MSDLDPRHFKHEFETETGQGIYCGEGKVLAIQNGSYNDAYVYWLVQKLANDVKTDSKPSINYDGLLCTGTANNNQRNNIMSEGNKQRKENRQLLEPIVNYKELKGILIRYEAYKHVYGDTIQSNGEAVNKFVEHVMEDNSKNTDNSKKLHIGSVVSCFLKEVAKNNKDYTRITIQIKNNELGVYGHTQIPYGHSWGKWLVKESQDLNKI